MTDLKRREEHFEFGQNWQSYAGLIEEDRIRTAEKNVRGLCGELSGKTFLDIGSGSGLFSLAALRAGADRVLAVDIDENSVAATRETLSALSEGDRWEARQVSVFDLPATSDRFDVVYSWGVLHHTGAMREAVKSAAQMVAPGGIFAFALYERTPLCGLWRTEKRFYSRAPGPIQAVVRGLYIGLHAAGRIAKGKRPRPTDQGRGMDYVHDIHDWLGGYPYESTTLAEIDPLMAELGFTRTLHRPVAISKGGLMGTGCSEYVYRRAPHEAAPASAASRNMASSS